MGEGESVTELIAGYGRSCTHGEQAEIDEKCKHPHG